MPKITTVTIQTQKSFNQLFFLDNKLIGTPDYLGLAYFWNYEYRHYLRDASESQRKKVHQLFLKFNLPISGASKDHETLIRKVLKIS
jgi:hypothetical protein